MRAGACWAALKSQQLSRPRAHRCRPALTTAGTISGTKFFDARMPRKGPPSRGGEHMAGSWSPLTPLTPLTDYVVSLSGDRRLRNPTCSTLDGNSGGFEIAPVVADLSASRYLALSDSGSLVGAGSSSSPCPTLDDPGTRLQRRARFLRSSSPRRSFMPRPSLLLPTLAGALALGCADSQSPTGVAAGPTGPAFSVDRSTEPFGFAFRDDRFVLFLGLTLGDVFTAVCVGGADRCGRGAGAHGNPPRWLSQNAPARHAHPRRPPAAGAEFLRRPHGRFCGHWPGALHG